MHSVSKIGKGVNRASGVPNTPQGNKNNIADLHSRFLY